MIGTHPGLAPSFGRCHSSTVKKPCGIALILTVSNAYTKVFYSMPLIIERLSALEILDSRGRPTVRARCRLAGGAEAAASVPSGASTGSSEMLELRDGDTRRYRGLGCRRAVANINETLHTVLAGRTFADQATLDRMLVHLDGTTNKSRLGANALLAVSLAFARAT